MSLLDIGNFVEIKLYYMFKEVKATKKLFILEDIQAEKLLKNEEKSKNVGILNTKWKPLNWKEQNEVMELSSKSDPTTGESQFKFVVYRDAVVKRCLKEWDIKENGVIVPVTPEKIDSLPANIVTTLFQRFEEINDYTEEQLKN